VFHHRGQLDHEGLRQRADGRALFAFEPGENRPPSRVDERRKCPPEPFMIVHHIGKYWSERAGCQPGILDRGKSMEGDIHCLLGWVGALARPWPAIFRNYRSVNPGITAVAVGTTVAGRPPRRSRRALLT